MEYTAMPRLSPRLSAAADLARPHSFVADVGTDHAYLPIALLLAGRIRGGVVSDVHKGPLARATAHLREAGLEGRLTPVLCDGLSALQSYDPEDIFILGMGGELIASILAAAPWVKEGDRRLILQPMTHPELLRRYLLAEGYAIREERLVEEEKIYQILSAEYTGEPETFTEAELLFGRDNLRRRDDLTHRLLLHWQTVLLRRREGKRSAGADTSEEDKLLQEIGGYLS